MGFEIQPSRSDFREKTMHAGHAAEPLPGTPNLPDWILPVAPATPEAAKAFAARADAG